MVSKIIHLEEALLMTGFGKYNIGLLILCGTIMMGMIFETLGLSYIIPAAQCDLELSLTEKGWLGAIPFIGIIISSHFWGWLADTRGRKPVIMWTMGVGCIFSILSSLCPTLLSFSVMRMIAAIFISGPVAVVVAYLGEFSNPIYRDRMVTLVSAFISIGTLILPALAWLVIPMDMKIPIDLLGIVYKPWRLLVVVLALPYLVSSIIMIWVHESPKFLANQGKTKEAMEVIKAMYRINKGSMDIYLFEYFELENKAINTEKVSMLQSMWDQTVPLFRPPLLLYTSIACFVQFGTFACANGFYLWIPELLNRIFNQINNGGATGTVCEILTAVIEHNITTVYTNASVVMSTECFDTVHTETFVRSLILAAIYSPVIISAAFTVHILGKRNILIIAPLVAGAAGYAIHWVKDQNFALFLIGVFQLDGICIGMTNAMVVEIFPTHVRAMAVSLSQMAGRLGSILGSNIIGLLMEVYCPSTFFLFSTLLFLCSATCIWFPKPKKAIQTIN